MARVKIDTDVLTRCSASMNDKVSQFADLNARLQQLTAYLGVADKLRDMPSSYLYNDGISRRG